MILIKDLVDQKSIFDAVRVSVQELHPDKDIRDDALGAPFLFKTLDAKIWVRIFYRAMQDFTLEALKEEIKKLWVLMPQDSSLYLFYPKLDREQILKMNGLSDRLSFFEYGDFCRPGMNRQGVHICKWIPSISIDSLQLEKAAAAPAAQLPPSIFLQSGRLTVNEIADLTDLSLALRQV